MRFVIKLPSLDGLENRVERVSLAYQQEYNLRDRFPPGEPRVLPALIPDNRRPPLLESIHPWLLFAPDCCPSDVKRVPCLVREFVEGKSLGAWARGVGNNGSADPRDFLGLRDSSAWFAIASALLKALAELHRERATHGFLNPENIILRREAFQGSETQGLLPDGNIVFTNAAESHRSIYLDEAMLSLNGAARHLPVRRYYDLPHNTYRLAEKQSPWIRFALEHGSDYYSSTDIFSLGVTLAYLARERLQLICAGVLSVPFNRKLLRWGVPYCPRSGRITLRGSGSRNGGVQGRPYGA